MVVLELDADRALFENKINGLVVTSYENERPLGGLLGLLDWRFQGALSQCFRSGAMTGKVGECTYFPVTKGQRTYHLIVVGCGHTQPDGRRGAPPLESLKIVQKNLTLLKLQQIAVSKSDFGNVKEDFFEKTFKGIPLWIVP